MKVKIVSLLKKYNKIIRYLFFGVCTTVINILVYAFCTRWGGLTTVLSTCIAWTFSVMFAYLTNRIWVFDSVAVGMRNVGKEVLSFFLCRVSTGILDVILMLVFVDWLGINDMMMKIISNAIVIVLNYLASKVFVFKGGGHS